MGITSNKYKVMIIIIIKILLSVRLLQQPNLAELIIFVG